jgi:hypothetical protein
MNLLCAINLGPRNLTLSLAYYKHMLSNHRIRLKEWPSVDESKEDTEIATDEVTK